MLVSSVLTILARLPVSSPSDLGRSGFILGDCQSLIVGQSVLTGVAKPALSLFKTHK